MKFFCWATHSGPIIHTVNYAMSCGIPLVAAVTSIAWRGLPAWAAASPSACWATASGRSTSWFSACWRRRSGRLVFVRELAMFYAVAALFGFIYAGTMPFNAALARENFPLRMMGTVIGGTAMAGSLGMATALAGGLIYDTLASYTWLYVGSWIMGLGAFFIAMTFRPVPKLSPAAVPA